MKYRILSAQTRILKEHITSDGEHIKKTEDEYVISEFPPNVPWAGRHNVINAASGHHISEGKWLKNPKKYLEDYNEFVEILNNNYENQEELRREILNYTRFGNDSDADEYAVIAANSFLDAVDELELKENYYAIGGFYSLERDNTWTVRATPDGRKDGDPFSENQSPTYGADKNGITALLKSLSKLPFERTATGGLNITFSQNVSADILKALAVSYFKLGGLHIGISVINAETLKDAMKNPNKYKSLTVRLYGFSEYFVSLPKWQQMAVLNRTQY